MRVMVTGGTGFVGAHSVRALVDAGHEVRLLVRDPARMALALGSLGLEPVDHVVGEMGDVAAVRAALDGCDAVLHCAAVVGLGPRRAAEVVATNPRGAQVVVGEAAARGLDPIVVVSSAAALFAPGVSRLHVDLPPASAKSGYGRSKAETERIVRAHQERGAPVTITYPGGVLGPPVRGGFGGAAEGIVMHLRVGALFTGAMSAIDVRDLAAIHAAAMQPGRGPRRYLCGGHHLPMKELAVVLRRLTGRPFPVLPVPGGVLRGLGRAIDAVTRVSRLESVLGEEALAIHTGWPPSDDHRVREELGALLRPFDETLAETIRALLDAGRVTARQAGRLAARRRP